ncbi:hypothetical protein ACMA1I_18300 [Pontibacter sp. 13R65]|uniref:hypothetical protein n=1 Tax=Pontibacter sp. 13R65 TaxID=3127458 RepID=UPI0039C8F039
MMAPKLRAISEKTLQNNDVIFMNLCTASAHKNDITRASPHGIVITKKHYHTALKQILEETF